VDDVLGQNAGDKVPMEKVVMLLWAFRDDESVVTFMAQFVSKVRLLFFFFFFFRRSTSMPFYSISLIVSTCLGCLFTI
jgi:hypothetical protein